MMLVRSREEYAPIVCVSCKPDIRFAAGFQKIRRIQRVKNGSPTEPVMWVCDSPSLLVGFSLFHFSIILPTNRIFKSGNWPLFPVKKAVLELINISRDRSMKSLDLGAIFTGIVSL
jgi:hypothetical protein